MYPNLDTSCLDFLPARISAAKFETLISLPSPLLGVVAPGTLLVSFPRRLKQLSFSRLRLMMFLFNSAVALPLLLFPIHSFPALPTGAKEHFLDESSHLWKRDSRPVRPSARPLVCPSAHPLVLPSVRPSRR